MAPYTQKDFDHFRELLSERRRRILESVTAMESEALKEAGQAFSVDHMADHGSDNFDQELTLSLVETEREELFEIDKALERLGTGGFGVCEGTGEPIVRARLEAIPYTRYSIEYQRRIESGALEEPEEDE